MSVFSMHVQLLLLYHYAYPRSATFGNCTRYATFLARAYGSSGKQGMVMIYQAYGALELTSL